MKTNVMHTLRPGEFLIGPEGAFAVDVPESSGGLVTVFLSPGFIADMAVSLGIGGETASMYFNFPLIMDSSLADLALCMNNLFSAGFPLKEKLYQAEELCMEAVGIVLRFLRLKKEALEHLNVLKESTKTDLFERLTRARNLIETRFAENTVMRELAEGAAISEYHFMRLFREAFGISPGQYRKRVRLEAARSGILYSDKGITEISLDSGYSSLSSFIHAFRERFGCSPGALRKSAGLNKPENVRTNTL